MIINRTTQKFLIGLAFTCGILMSSTMVNASPCSPTTTPPEPPAGFTGLSFNTLYCGNDPFDGQGGYINGSPSLIKWTPLNSFEEGIATGTYVGNLTLSSLTYTGGDLTGGTWSWTHDFGELFPTIMVVKASDGFFIQSVAGLLTGTFSTLGLLEGHALSHLSFYDGAGGGDSVPDVPLPAALPMLLAGLGGLTWLSRRRSSSAA